MTKKSPANKAGAGGSGKQATLFSFFAKKPGAAAAPAAPASAGKNKAASSKPTSSTPSPKAKGRGSGADEDNKGGAGKGKASSGATAGRAAQESKRDTPLKEHDTAAASLTTPPSSAGSASSTGAPVKAKAKGGDKCIAAEDESSEDEGRGRGGPSKKRRVLVDSDESGDEGEWGVDKKESGKAQVTKARPASKKARRAVADDGDDDGDSDYADADMGEAADRQEEEEEAEMDDWLADDDDDEEEEGRGRGKGKGKRSGGGRGVGGKKLRRTGDYSITETKGSASAGASLSAFARVPPAKSNPYGATNKNNNDNNNNNKNDSAQKATPSKGGSVSSSSSSSSLKAPSSASKSLPSPARKELRIETNHIHHSLPWLNEDRRDAKKRRPDHPDYNDRTLFVPPEYLKKLPPGQQQWWVLKAQNMDTVLFFKVGKFYELYHMDADIGVNEIDLIYMKEEKAHSGFPEISYGKFSNQLVDKGYRVARVEQTETPEGLKERNSRLAGKKDKVVRRELCSVVSRGTRTYCFLDDISSLPDDGSASSQSILLSIREKPILAPQEQHMEVEEEEDKDDGGGGGGGARPVMEYGITLCESTTATLRLGQFADGQDRSRLRTLLSSLCPAEVLYPRGQLSETTLHMIRCIAPSAIMVPLDADSEFWDADKTLEELHKADYFTPTKTKGKKKRRGREEEEEEEEDDDEMEEGGGGDGDMKHWPEVLKSVVKGGEDAALALSSFGGALHQLRRSLIDHDLVSMKRVGVYIPPEDEESEGKEGGQGGEGEEMAASNQKQMEEDGDGDGGGAQGKGLGKAGAKIVREARKALAREAQKGGGGGAGLGAEGLEGGGNGVSPTGTPSASAPSLGGVTHMVLDGVSLSNLEVLSNSFDGSAKGSLWASIDRCCSAFGRRLLRDWLTRPLLQAARINTRLDAVAELALDLTPEADACRNVLRKCPDIERLLSRVHSMASVHRSKEHPDSRAVMYEGEKHGKRKIADFVQVLDGLERASTIPGLFKDQPPNASLLQQCCLMPAHHHHRGGKMAADGKTASSSSSTTTDEGGGKHRLGHFPDMAKEVGWFRTAFDAAQAKRLGNIKPKQGQDEDYDEALQAVAATKEELAKYLVKQRAELKCREVIYYDSAKDKYQLQVPITALKNGEPSNYSLSSKTKKHKRYYTPFITRMIAQMAQQEAEVESMEADYTRKLFARFDDKRELWAAAVDCMSHLDALLSLAEVSSRPGYTRPCFRENCESFIRLSNARHPCLEQTYFGDSFIPNDMALGKAPAGLSSQLPQGIGKGSGEAGGEEGGEEGGAPCPPPRMLLLSGPNMGGKSTLLRQTCLVAILAQLGCFVPADSAVMTPFDRIFTRVGASDRILAGQSTFFVELAETANIIHHATRRSLVILDELGRGTSTFDGTAIAHAVVKYLVSDARCLGLFATHYHSLIEEWSHHPEVALGHMDCLVEGEGSEQLITFLYKLASGSCPKSFGINVARLAKLPEQVITKAATTSHKFQEDLMEQRKRHTQMANKAQQLVVQQEKEEEGAHGPPSDEAAPSSFTTGDDEATDNKTLLALEMLRTLEEAEEDGEEEKSGEKLIELLGRMPA